jgi:hypothetical protein
MALKRWHIWLLGTGFLLLVSCLPQTNSYQVDEQYTLRSSDNRPFGASVSQSITDRLFSALDNEVNRYPFHTWFEKQKNGTAKKRDQVYVLLSPNVIAWEQEIEAMRTFVEQGNTLLLVTDKINEEMEEQLALQIFDDATTLPFIPTPPMRDTWLQLHDTARLTYQQFSYFYFPMAKRLSAGSQYQSVVTLATNDAGRPTALRIRMGRGQLLLATNARSFSNYFLLSQQNLQYLLGLYAYLPAEPSRVFWDDFYCRNLYRQPEDYSILSSLLSIPALRWAFWILLVAGLLWVLSNLRRKQKMIAVLAPNTNSTVSFVQTIAQLYYNKADHANIARKITAHLSDQLRSRYYLPPQLSQTDWENLLQHKALLNQEEAAQLAALMQKAQETDFYTFTDQDLLHMHWLAHKATHG